MRAPPLLERPAAPAWARPNPFLLTGYRPALPPGAALRSLFWWHNETVNVWLHLLGLAAAACLLVRDNLALHAAGAGAAERLAANAFLVGMGGSMAASVGMHLLACTSPWLEAAATRADLAGIVGFLWAAEVPPALLGPAAGRPGLRALYLAGASALALAGAGAILARPGAPPPRVWLPAFGVLGAWGLARALHEEAALPGGGALRRWAGASAFFLAGGAFYFLRAPERFAPRRFDLVGASHQVWHACALAGALAHHRGCWELLAAYSEN